MDWWVDVEVWFLMGDDVYYIEFELFEVVVVVEVGFVIFWIEVNLFVDGCWVLVVIGDVGMILLLLIVMG